MLVAPPSLRPRCRCRGTAPRSSRRPRRRHARPHRPTYGQTGSIEVLPVQGSVYLLAGGGSNVVVQVGDDARASSWTPTRRAMSDKMLAAIRTLSKAADPLHRQHRRRSAITSAATRRWRRRPAAPVNAFLQQGARVYAHENTYTRLANPPDGTNPAPVALWPTDAFTGPKKTLFVTGEPIELIHQPAAHTDGDVMVFFRKSDVVAAGDVFVLDGYPVIDTEARRHAAGRHRRAEPPGGYRRPRVQRHGRHPHRAGPRPHRQRDRRRRVPRHADDHPRPRRADGGGGAHARAGQAARRVARLRRRVRHQRRGRGRPTCSSRPPTGS